MHSYYEENELQKLGFKKLGKHVLISKKASIYGADKISIGNYVRIDDFCILSGYITLENYIHIAAYSALYGGVNGIEICDYANISSRVSIYAINDDYSGESMTNPMIPSKFKHTLNGKVIIEKHVIIGSGCVILPEVILAEGSSFGALTFINKNSEPWSIYAGIPFRKIKERSKNVLELEILFRKEVI